MKKILLSLAIIGAVGAGVVGATGAFFNDTETSQGNIFVAGDLDLKVDHTYASYLGEECVGNCTEDDVNLIVNGNFDTDTVTDNGGQWQVYPSGITGWSVVSGNGIELQANGVAGNPHSFPNLVELDSHPASGSQTVMEQVINTVPGQQYRLKFWHSPRPNNTPDTDNAIALKVLVTSDSGTIIDTTIGQPSQSSSVDWDEYVYNFIALDTQTTVRFGDAGSQADTFGGYLDDVSVVALECETTNLPYGGQCVLWGERDLEPSGSYQFWNFPDVKPGDWGKNIISLHVYSNDAYACLMPNNVVDNDNAPTEPELAYPDPTTSPTGGELSQYLKFFMWQDIDGDNNYDQGEPVLVKANTPFTQIQTEMIALSLQGNAPITLVGIEWCAGTQTGPQVTNDPGPVQCNGAGMGDIAQTDSTIADFVAYAVQQRNNTGFQCDDVVLNP
jgi:predicted ribosomally synthesized peptide with SipW-like signal peptide